MSRIVLVAIFLAVFAGCGLVSGPPRLVVMIVVDQLGYSYIERFEGLYEGGFRTLLEDAWRGYDPSGKFTNINCVGDFAEDRTAIGGEGAVDS